jgi:putative phage-type endonuclease
MAQYSGMGKLGKIIKEIKTIIKRDYTDSIYSTDDYFCMIKDIYNIIVIKYSDTSYQLIKDIISRMVNINYNISSTINDVNFRDWDKHYNISEVNNSHIIVPPEFVDLDKHFTNLYLTPQPEQKTKEWFDYRFNRITASDMATAIDCNPYESVEGFICKKCDPNFPFLDNDFVFHGKKYEQIATSLYEHIYNSKMTEFGCLPSDKYKFLGASPDGIGSKSTLDYKFNNKLGYMLEIKCPYVRPIKNKGKIAGEICPYYYYCQVQQQLECCDLEYCDFIQCKIKEYDDRDAYLKDTSHKMNITEDVDGRYVDVSNVMSKGYLLQFLPKEYKPLFDGDKHHYKSFYIYPPRLTMSQQQYDEWVLTTLNNWKTNYPEKADTYYFDKVIYWKIYEAHTVTIPRDVDWFNSVYPVLKETWDKVCYYREHLDELPQLQEIADKRKKFYKMKTDFTINNVEPNTPFLDNKQKKKKVVKKIVEDDCDFVD